MFTLTILRTHEKGVFTLKCLLSIYYELLRLHRTLSISTSATNLYGINQILDCAIKRIYTSCASVITSKKDPNLRQLRPAD